MKQPKHVDDGTTADEDEEIDCPTSTLHATQSDTPPIADKLKADQVSEKRPNNSGSAPKDRLGTATAASKPSSYFTVKKATYKFKSVQENDLDDGNKADQEDNCSDFDYPHGITDSPIKSYFAVNRAASRIKSIVTSSKKHGNGLDLPTDEFGALIADEHFEEHNSDSNSYLQYFKSSMFSPQRSGLFFQHSFTFSKTFLDIYLIGGRGPK